MKDCKDYSQYITHLVYSPKSHSFELSLTNDTHFIGAKAKSLIEWLWLNKGESQAFRPIEIARVTRSDRKQRLKTVYTSDELKDELISVMQSVADEYMVEVQEFKLNSFMGHNALYAYVDVEPEVLTDLNFGLCDVVAKDGHDHLCNFECVGIFDYRKERLNE